MKRRHRKPESFIFLHRLNLYVKERFIIANNVVSFSTANIVYRLILLTCVSLSISIKLKARGPNAARQIILYGPREIKDHLIKSMQLSFLT